MDKITIAIAEDNIAALGSVTKKLAAFNEIGVAIVAHDGSDLLGKLMVTPVDLVLMDIEMPVLDGIAATKLVNERYPTTKVLMLTVFDDDEKVFQSILSGASGYLLKEEPIEVLVKAIVDIHNGGAVMSPGIALKAIHYIKQTAVSPQKSSQDISILSQRETEILQELKNGLGYKQIAHQLFISEGTVRKHIENIYRKLQVNNKMSAVKVAASNNWL